VGSNPTPSAKTTLNYLIYYFSILDRACARSGAQTIWDDSDSIGGRFRAGGRKYFHRRLVVTVQEVPAEVSKAARRVTIPDDTRRALPCGSPPERPIQVGSDSWQNWTRCGQQKITLAEIRHP
jgi:hypothetical protein